MDVTELIQNTEASAGGKTLATNLIYKFLEESYDGSLAGLLGEGGGDSYSSE